MTHPAVMVVDGDHDSRRLLSFGLREAAFEVSSAETVQQALERLQRARLDAIVSEVTVASEGDGLELRHRLLAHQSWATVPFIFISAAQAMDQRLRASALGVDHFLSKPVLLQELVGLLRELVTPDGERTDSDSSANSIALLDTLFLLQASRKSAVVEVDADGKQGAIHVRDGVLVDSEFGSRFGSTALFRLLSLKRGTHEIHYRPVVRPRRIAEPLQTLIPRTIERVERWRSLGGALPDLGTRCTVDLSQLREPVDQLPWQVRALISLLERGKTLAAVIEQGALDDLQALACLGKLHRRGVLVMARGTGEQPVDDPPGPSTGRETERTPAQEVVAGEDGGPAGRRAEAEEPATEPTSEEPALDPTIDQPGQRAARDTVEDRVVAFSETVHGFDNRHWIRMAKVLALVGISAMASVGLYRLFSRPDAATVTAAQAFSSPDAGPRAALEPERTDPGEESAAVAPPGDGGAATQPVAAGWRDEEDYPSLLTRARVLSRFNIRMTKELLERAIETRPEGWEALQDMALVLLIRGRSAEALSHARQALQIEPDAPYALLVSGVVLQESGRLREAERAYRRFVVACPRCRYVQDVRRVIRTMRESRATSRRSRR